ncbi:cysteine protease family C02 [Achlya hypogyna]|uniref:Cysteine protease family C02 n=1 Tax=Achlya hypogyna TaxID=1202772 RepID=A0A1V9ZAX7_ACHHY|nr:cysteine protease family C02 [Achlya hypogyna]
MELEQDLKEHGVEVVCSKMDTIISMRAHGATGKRLMETLRLMDKYVAVKVTKLVKACDGHIYCDPCFGPGDTDGTGALALCKNGDVVPSKGASQHQAKVLKMLKEDKLRWERPRYAATAKAVLEDDDEIPHRSADDDPVFCDQGELFCGGLASSGDVIQGNLGDCWFLGAISVLATRMDLLKQVFWRDDQYKEHGLFVCRFMKDFSWHYVIIDDRIPVFGYTNNRAGKPFFARCSDPNELWVPLMEKAYAKLHGSYEAIIGGYIDVALSDLTGLCSEQIILKPGHPGFAEDPYKPIRAGQQRGDEFWQKMLDYKRNGTLMGCSIQPDPKGDKNVVAEGSAGQGLYYKHAYGLVDLGEITLADKSVVRLVKVRNPWGMGEWTGAWSDQSDERETYDAEIQRVFKLIARSVGANAYSKLFREQHRELRDGPQEDVAEINQSDGTFFMTYHDWSERFTHFFAGIDFADEWCGLRVQGKWDEVSCGGNTTKSTWINNPRFQLLIKEQCHIFISVSQNDPRGKADATGIVPIGFHVCSVEVGTDGKVEIREPKKKPAPYYRLHPEANRAALIEGKMTESSPPPIIPGTVIPGIDDDGVPQPAYTLKLAASVDVTIEPGRYCIVPSLFMRTDKQSGKTNVGPFWLSVYGNKPAFDLEGGEPIIEEEEASDASPVSPKDAPAVALAPIIVPGDAARRQFENLKEEFLGQARAKGIGFREAKREFSNVGPMRRADFKRRMMNLGFKMDEVSDEKVNILFEGLDKEKRNTILAVELLEIFVRDIDEDRIAAIAPEKEDEEVPEKVNQEGTLSLRLVGGKDLTSVDVLQTTPPLLNFPALAFGAKDVALQDACMLEVLEEEPALIAELHPTFLLALRPHDPIFQSRISALADKTKGPARATKSRRRGPKKKLVRHDTTPVGHFFAAVDAKVRAALAKEAEERHLEAPEPKKRFSWTALQPAAAAPPPVAPDEHGKLLHTSALMQGLEAKRSNRFRCMQQAKAQAFGNKQKQASLPRLLGGRKSGTNTLRCVDCCAPVVLSGKSEAGVELSCAAQGCVHVFCPSCYDRLPAGGKFCDDCYLHEHGNMEVLGMQLRSLLLSKLAASDAQLLALDAIFASLDEDNSGDLTVPEFTKFLARLNLHPPLSAVQVNALMDELDVDGSGTLSLGEFKQWMLGKEAAWVPEMATDADEAWLRSPRAGRRSTLEDSERATVVPWVQALLGDLLEDVLGSLGGRTGPWCVTSPVAPTIEMVPKTALDARWRTETVVFQRVAALPVVDGSTNECESIAKLFARFDVNGDGSIATDELALLLACVGLDASPLDVRLLGHRLQRSHGHILLADFAHFVHTEASATTLQRERALYDQLLDLEQRIKEHRTVEAEVKLALLGLHEGMAKHELLWLSKALLDLVGAELAPATLQRIALVCTPCIYDAALTCAGDVLLALLQAPAGLAGALGHFSVEAVSSAIQRLFKIEAKDEELEWEKLGPVATDALDQGAFIEGLLRRGLRLREAQDVDCLAVENQVCVALALDALRYRDAQLPPVATRDVPRGLFLSLSRYTTLRRLEDKLRRALQRLARIGSGQQMYQVTMAVGHDQALHVRVVDALLKQVMTLAFKATEMNTSGVPLFARRSAGTAPWTVGTVNAEWYPELNAYCMGLVRRLRICYRDDNGKKRPFLEFLESPAFVATLRRLLQSTRVPFFWAVSPAALELSVDRATLERAKLRLQPFAMQAILAFPALAAFFRQAHSTLRVHLEVLDRPSAHWMGWSEFQACLAGLRNAYATIQLLPQGDIFVTPPDDGGGCTPQWDYTTTIRVREPDECERRSDRPVVYVDTQPIVDRPDSSGTNLIPFTTLDRVAPGAAVHFVVISVRKTVPTTAEAPRLYCTAYDPATASDYEVVGTPTNWSPAFFDPDANRDIEGQWQALVGNMKLGRTITPKLLIRVYNKQPRSDQLIGETEVSIASTMAREGYGVHSWFCIYSPVTETRERGRSSVAQQCTGQIELQVQFEMKTKAADGRAEPADRLQTTPRPATVATSRPSVVDTPREGCRNSSTEESELAHYKQRLAELEAQLRAKPVDPPSDSSSNNAVKWKRKYEQLKQEAQDQQTAAENQLAALQRQVAALAAPPPTPASTDASAAATFAALRATLSARCPERPLIGLQKAMLAVAQAPGKVAVAAFEEVLDDFGLRLASLQMQNVLCVLDPDGAGILSISEFFGKLGGDGALSRASSRAALELPSRSDKPVEPKPPAKAATPRQPPSPEAPLTQALAEDAPGDVKVAAAAGTAPRKQLPPAVDNGAKESKAAREPKATPVAESDAERQSTKSKKVAKPEAKAVPAPSTRDEREEVVVESNNTPFQPSSDAEMFQYLQAHLPPKWDMQFTAGGKPYFRDFVARSTQWNHPVADVDALYKAYLQAKKKKHG